MDTEKKLKDLLDKLFINTGATFSGIFIDEKPTISKTIYTDRKEKLEEILKLIIYKAHQINEFIKDFGEEYVYAEGNDISIFIYFVRPDIAVASVIEEKPKFALLKLEHTTIAKKIKNMEEEIDQFIKGEISTPDVEEIRENEGEFEEIELESLEEAVPELKEEEPLLETEKEKTEITVEDIKDRYAEEVQEIEKTEDLEELEKVLSESEEPSLEEILKVPEETEIKEVKEEPEEKEETQPLEEPTEEELYQPEILEQIQKELLKEIGPVGKFLFKKRKKELDIQEDRLTRTVIVKLIEKLSDDIIDEKRKKRFLEKVSAFI
ncbi:hypothetical protein GWK41_00030 [Persephonella atlantica]|uniref:DUF8082 domain-containing protein n=1 Tax=Persephonella atlantica TaxID=2699429 RepID=A0ABS1GES4_9AQUI|nr:hypothetical protein [Persephonella atlantica]MBK3331449.1 hypothetical protein [Persephonella atlantica]